MASPPKLTLLPVEIITEILLRLSPKPLSKFKCVSKSWLKLISSSEFVKTHLKLSANNNKNFSHHGFLFSDEVENFKVCSLSCLSHKEPISSFEVFDMDSPNSITVGSINGLICLVNWSGQIVLWNPTIRKSKKLSKLGFGLYPTNYGFGYDELHDDYKVVCIAYVGNRVTKGKIYSLKTDCWRTIDEFPGGRFVNRSGEFVNGKLYWFSSDVLNFSFNITNETWGKLELPCCAKDNPHVMLGVVGSDLSMLSVSRERPEFDVWIMKECGVNVSWTKMFTVNDVSIRMAIELNLSFSIHILETNEGEILLKLPAVIMICNPKDGSTRRVEVTGFHKCSRAEIYVESLVDPVLIADRESHNHETSQSFS